MILLSAERIPFGFIDAEGNPYLSLVRDQLASAFLDQFAGVENLFFIDDDLGWPARKVVEFIRRPEAIVAGIYPLKNESGNYPCNLVMRDGAPVSHDGLLLASSAPVGFCRIKREVLEAVASRSRRYKEAGASVSYNGTLYAMFDQGVHGGVFVEGDIAFIRKAAQLGINAWIDPDIEFSHRGNHVWRGKFADTLERAA